MGHLTEGLDAPKTSVLLSPIVNCISLCTEDFEQRFRSNQIQVEGRAWGAYFLKGALYCSSHRPPPSRLTSSPFRSFPSLFLFFLPFTFRISFPLVRLPFSAVSSEFNLFSGGRFTCGGHPLHLQAWACKQNYEYVQGTLTFFPHAQQSPTAMVLESDDD